MRLLDSKADRASLDLEGIITREVALESGLKSRQSRVDCSRTPRYNRQAVPIPRMQNGDSAFRLEVIQVIGTPYLTIRSGQARRCCHPVSKLASRRPRPRSLARPPAQRF